MKHIFFDLDRTLWDFETNSKRALQTLYKDLELNRMIKTFESFYKTYKNTNAALWNQYGKGKITKDVLRTKRFEDTLRQYQVFDKELAYRLGEDYVAISPKQTSVFPGTHDTLDSLKKEEYILHIITNGFKEVQFIKLEKSGLLDYFDVIVCSEDVGVNKPDPKVFHHAVEKAGANINNSIMIGDDYQVDIIGACNVGMEAILFDPHKNYREGTHEWHVNELREIPEKITWIRRSNL